MAQDSVIFGEVDRSVRIRLPGEGWHRENALEIVGVNRVGSHGSDSLVNYNLAWMPGLIATDVIRLIKAFSPRDDGEALKSQDLTLALLSWSHDPFSRMIYTPGHVTCTGVVLGPDRDRVLLVHHRRLDRWLLPGGHCEPGDPSIESVAQREVIEETGAILTSAAGTLVNIDVHPIPANKVEPLHLHHDLIFAFDAAALDTECSAESRAVTWCGLDEFDRYHLPGPIRRAALRAAAALHV